jgi:hypothetical protein
LPDLTQQVTMPERRGNRRTSRTLGERQILSLHGRVLLHIHLHPGLPAHEIAEGLSLSIHTIWSVIGDLRHADMLIVQRDHRRHRYNVNTEALARHPALGSLTVGRLLRSIPVAQRAR